MPPATKIRDRRTRTVTAERSFTENGAGTYTASVSLPAGATLIDIIVNGVALWSAATSATMKVGDAADDDGYYTAVDLKALDLLAGESLSLTAPGGQHGAYVVPGATDDAYQISRRYVATARTISGVVTSVGAGTAGRTRMLVIYAVPSAADVVAATKA